MIGGCHDGNNSLLHKKNYDWHCSPIMPMIQKKRGELPSLILQEASPNAQSEISSYPTPSYIPKTIGLGITKHERLHCLSFGLEILAIFLQRIKTKRFFYIFRTKRSLSHSWQTYKIVSDCANVHGG